MALLFENLLRNYWANCIQISQECSLGGPLSYSSKEWPPGKEWPRPGAYQFFKRKSLKDLLLRNCYANCIQISQECYLGGLFSDSFKVWTPGLKMVPPWGLSAFDMKILKYLLFKNLYADLNQNFTGMFLGWSLFKFLKNYNPSA